MSYASINLISGPPGVGKSSIANTLAENSAYKRAVIIRMDDFYGYISKGYIEPWHISSDGQNAAIIEAMAACAKSFAKDDYEVFVDGVIGQRYLTPWVKIANNGFSVFYVVLRPSLQMTIERGVNRKGEGQLTDSNVIKQMWEYFSDLGSYESNVIDTTDQTLEESITVIRNALNKGHLRIV